MSTLLTPNPAEYRYALYCRSDQLDISYGARKPVALYREEALAQAHGARMWPGAFTVIDLQGGDPCANPN
ncbi:MULTISPECIES: hypothetical protein [Pseudomonas]|uniref:hypothetical protein n=1 Tax=Pseudomonas TaxID=286 RepID=UPI0020230337|nr:MULTISPECIES: hypothetical protein [Pseudomonas]MCL8308835.1 hypothetical protein [Pseudomonas putida]